jgi:uncharacterized membrane protein
VIFGVACFAIWIVEHIILTILSTISFGILGLLGLLFLLVWLAMIAFWVFLVIQAYSNKQFRIPVIGDIAAKQAGL